MLRFLKTYCFYTSRFLLTNVVALLIVSSFAVAQTLTPEQLEQLRARQADGSNTANQSPNTALGQSAFNGSLFNQSGGQNISPNQALTSESDQFLSSGRSNRLLPGEQRVELLLPPSADGAPPPYGANLFAGGYESERIDGLNDDYLVAAGDKINIWLWGAVNFSQVVTVDNQGNIFIPNVGPIQVANTRASQLNTLVTRQIKTIYERNVQIYVNLLTATPISVYIAGPVIRPGQYAGMASDSVLYFLKRAGGIDAERGSYRKIQILRSGEVVSTIDLYAFIRDGQLPAFTFKDRDVILVGQKGSTVTVAEGAQFPFRFEFLKSVTLGTELASYSKPLSKISHVAIVGTRSEGPFSVYIPYDEFLSFKLSSGDSLIFHDDWDPEVYDIKVSGSHLGPSYYTVKKRTRLHDILSQVEVDPALADYSNVYVLRQSVALRQKEIIDQSLDRLERSVFTAPIRSTGEGTIRSQEAALVSDFVRRAKEIVPLGKVIVSENGVVANILLEQGDEIVIPQKTDLVQVGGEVLTPQAVVYNKKAKVEDYVAWAGGYSDRAETKKILIVSPNGLATFADIRRNGWFSSGSARNLKPGDQILVLPKVDSKALQAVKDITQVIYQIAIAANVVTR